jgi:molybdate transport system regulatory protein
MQPRFNLWIEVGGEVALSAWRVRLLEAIADTGSISGAAEKMGIGYRQAWAKLRECEARLGVPLVETTVGGSGGGGAQLTAAGQTYIDKYHRLVTGLEDLIHHRYDEIFGPAG